MARGDGKGESADLHLQEMQEALSGALKTAIFLDSGDRYGFNPDTISQHFQSNVEEGGRS
jgi:hypothetical protein